MKRRIFSLLFFAFAFSTEAQQFDTLSSLFSQSSVLNRHFYGFSLYDLDENKYVYGVRDEARFTPASNTKLFTLFQSLKHLGDSIPGLAYIVKGDSLIFWGTGDPTFLHRKLDSGKVFKFLSKTRYKLYYAPAQVLETAYRNGWAAEDYQNDFQPDITSFPIYGNTVRFRNVRGNLLAIPKWFETKVSVKPGIAGFDIIRHAHENYFDMTSYRMPAGFSTEKPFIYNEHLFVELLRDTLKREIELLSGYSMPSQVRYIYSNSTRNVLREMMLYSDNFLAEQLNYVCSFLQFNQFNALKMRGYMNENFYQSFSHKIDLHDASGLSFYNKVTPNSMIELLLLLRGAVRDEQMLLGYFPAGRSSGTLRNMYTLHKGKPFIWAKTGTISGVYAQSGFLTSASGKRYAFSFMNNNHVDNLKAVKGEMVKIMTFIHHNF
ncbi:D-alanyl-D-alanine carboxypeptidase [Sphingobacterium corticis]|uniref:D-alanyl-D-alanine carboxypeptidase n=1 Tax=Sphingobacterium corticis TaxID=1812823 RepID=A0ABW5NMF9_9SPHI